MSDVAVKDKFEPIISVDDLKGDEIKRAKEIAKDIDVKNSQEVIQYGIGAQSQISSFADTILSEIRSKDGGEASAILGDLVMKVRGVNVGSLSDGGVLANIPILGNLVNSVKKFIARYEKLSTQIESITNELDKSKINLLKDITLLDNMYQKNLDYLKDLDIFIAAGQIKLDELYNDVLPVLKQKAQESSDPIDAQNLNDFAQALNRFEKKLHDLKLSRTVAIQTGPQLRLIQNNNQILVEKIQSSILNTIPLWKNQIIIAISLYRQKKSLKLQRAVADTTNDLLTRNSEALKTGSLEVAREGERGIVDIETLKKVNADLIETIEETIQIQKEGREKRKTAESEIFELENQLKKKLIEIQQ